MVKTPEICFTWGTLGRLAQDVLALANAEVAALLVVGGALAAFHHEGEVLVGEVSQQIQIQGCAEVVAVAHEHVLDAAREQLIQESASLQRRVQVAVTRGAPFVLWVHRSAGKHRLEGGEGSSV
jgi:hypothetical protein